MALVVAALAMAIVSIIIAIVSITVSVYALVRASTPLPAQNVEDASEATQEQERVGSSAYRHAEEIAKSYLRRQCALSEVREHRGTSIWSEVAAVRMESVYRLSRKSNEKLLWNTVTAWWTRACRPRRSTPWLANARYWRAGSTSTRQTV